VCLLERERERERERMKRERKKNSTLLTIDNRCVFAKRRYSFWSL